MRSPEELQKIDDASAQIADAANLGLNSGQIEALEEIASKDPPFYAMGPEWALIIACAFPIVYGLFDYYRRRQVSIMSVLGLVVVLIKGVFGLYKLPPIWLACSEAALPLLFGIAIILNSRAKVPLVQKMLLNPEHIDMPKINDGLKQRGNEGGLAGLMVHASWWFAATTLGSAILNFVLVMITVKTDPNPSYEAYETYVDEIGKFTALQYPFIMVPLMIGNIALLWWVLHKVKTLTGYGFTELMLNAPEVEPAPEGPDEKKE
ncbi:MAG: hypothetical protein ACI8UO_001157 [Verrucomicrobiales bacterium]|jgi:hypothetical protein